MVSSGSQSLEEVLGLDGSHAPRPRRGDGLPELLVLDVSRGEDPYRLKYIEEEKCLIKPTFDTRHSRAWTSDYVALFVALELAVEESRRGGVSDGKEDALRVYRRRRRDVSPDKGSETLRHPWYPSA